jgi:hypothetical protein
VLFDVVTGCLALLRRKVEDPHVAATRRVHRGDPASESTRAVDHDRALINIGRKGKHHG